MGVLHGRDPPWLEYAQPGNHRRAVLPDGRWYIFMPLPEGQIPPMVRRTLAHPSG